MGVKIFLKFKLNNKQTKKPGPHQHMQLLAQFLRQRKYAQHLSVCRATAAHPLFCLPEKQLLGSHSMHGIQIFS